MSQSTVMNTSQCMYDLGVCLSEEIDEESMLCTKSLHNDTICDFQNFLPECNFDGGDCQFEKGTFSHDCSRKKSSKQKYTAMDIRLRTVTL